jgi:sugar (pentulose or hexulose) kinase
MFGDLVIGLDSSTTATKAIAWDRNGRAVAEGRAPVALSIPQSGWFEQDAADWWGAAAQALQELAARIDMTRVAALAIANQRETFAQFDAEGSPLRPGTTWLDSRATAQVTELSNSIGADRIHQLSGKPADVVPCLYRCAWFHKHMPDMWRTMHKTAEVHGFLAYKFTGQWITSTASADPMGLLDLARQDWSDELMSAVGLDRTRLPELMRPGEKMGEVTPEAAAATGLAARTPVIAGGGDGQCAGTGTNVFLAGRAYINMGTAVVSGSFGAAYRHTRAFRTMTAVGERGFTYESAIRTGTFLVNWMVQQLFGLDSVQAANMFTTLEAEAAAVPIGSDGLITVPYWSGSMTPYWDSEARGVIAGLTSSHRRGHVYRSVLEGIALEQSMLTVAIEKVTSPIDHFVAIGGGSASPLWCQILADCTGRRVLRSDTVEASSLGAAIAAAKGAGWYATIAGAAAAMAGEPTATFVPDDRANARYAELLAIYADLWPALTKWNARIASFAQGGST